ncbi:hypothetical protein FH972_023296 [Carpinus fangiana]|uniref:Uncharacterized protein n=1 Tax=Carpinus fangiana TaxID=176857 RepID=A0A5N6KV49_9ROSI|nr:hypothetical protein FH972_023296 [Carpinus fangiana]
MAADARAMLRAARDARKVTHPHASYAGGNLSCTLCRVAIKAEAQWDSHLRSAGHVERVKAAKNTAGGLPNRKRKADDEVADQDDVKRSRVASAEPVGPEAVEREQEQDQTPAVEQTEEPAPQAQAQDEDVAADAVDNEEWDAFERDMKVLEAEPAQSQPPLASSAVISAAPVSAEELAARAREAQSQQRGRREEELEAEGEEAEARTNEEADEMQRLQERMQLLRERREALRKVGPKLDDDADDQKVDGEAVASEDDDHDEDEDIDDWENFGFRKT